MTDLTKIKRSVDLLTLVAQAGTKLKSTGYGWYAGPCPFCGGTDRFVLHQTPDGWRWFCRNCGDNKYRDVISFFQKWHGCDFQTAMDHLNKVSTISLAGNQRSTLHPNHNALPYTGQQSAVHEVVAQCTQHLWADTGIKARAWLNARGLQDDTLRQWQIGYCPGQPHEWCKIASLSVPCGIVVPCIVGDLIWNVKVRRAAGKPKYVQIKGGSPALFGADTLRHHDVAVVCEGEFDVLLLHQEACDLVGVATMGSASDQINISTWSEYLLPVAKLLVAYDVDGAGDKGASKLLSLTKRAQRLLVPVLKAGDKDITDYYKSGGDIRKWLIETAGLSDSDDTLIDAILTWGLSRGYEPKYGPSGNLVMVKDLP